MTKVGLVTPADAQKPHGATGGSTRDEGQHASSSNWSVAQISDLPSSVAAVARATAQVEPLVFGMIVFASTVRPVALQKPQVVDSDSPGVCCCGDSVGIVGIVGQHITSAF